MDLFDYVKLLFENFDIKVIALNDLRDGRKFADLYDSLRGQKRRNDLQGTELLINLDEELKISESISEQFDYQAIAIGNLPELNRYCNAFIKNLLSFFSEHEKIEDYLHNLIQIQRLDGLEKLIMNEVQDSNLETSCLMRYEESIEQYERDIIKFKSKIDEQDFQIKQLQVVIQEAQEKLIYKSQALDDLNDEINYLLTSFECSHISELETIIVKLREECANRAIHNEQIMNELDLYRQQLESEQVKSSVLITQIKNLQETRKYEGDPTKEVNQLKEQIDALQRRNENLESRLSKCQRSARSSYQLESVKNIERLREAEEKIKKLQSELDQKNFESNNCHTSEINEINEINETNEPEIQNIQFVFNSQGPQYDSFQPTPREQLYDMKYADENQETDDYLLCSIEDTARKDRVTSFKKQESAPMDKQLISENATLKKEVDRLTGLEKAFKKAIDDLNQRASEFNNVDIDEIRIQTKRQVSLVQKRYQKMLEQKEQEMELLISLLVQTRF